MKVSQILKKVWNKWNFELTVFELTGPNLYGCHVDLKRKISYHSDPKI